MFPWFSSKMNLSQSPKTASSRFRGPNLEDNDQTAGVELRLSPAELVDKETHGTPMGNPWEKHGKSMGKAWEKHGKRISSLWDLYRWLCLIMTCSAGVPAKLKFELLFGWQFRAHLWYRKGGSFAREPNNSKSSKCNHLLGNLFFWGKSRLSSPLLLLKLPNHKKNAAPSTTF